MEVQVSLGAAEGVSEDLLRSAVDLVLRDAGVTDGEISLALLDDQAIRELNRTYLGRDRPTDVMAFALHEEGESLLGDIYVGHEQALRQAGEMAVPLIEELVRLTIHGTLHVLGHGHPETDARFESEMFQLQERLLQELLDEAS
ncbi:MAG: rRNA maturation RNase YbeY [Longimicrobiales bacterium]